MPSGNTGRGVLAALELCIERSLKMTTLLWIAAAQPMLVAVILEIRGRRKSSRLLSKQKSAVRS